tara:strand:- start:753 stop:1721 length:969 start_codon:yes stop_codon:yes gene_type:complete
MNFIEVCSGAGGLSKGFIDTGFTPVLLNDNNKYCCETLKLNHPNVNIIRDSMTNLNIDNYKDIDLFMGGVPCQSFSQAGKRKALKDDRGKLMTEFIKMVDKLNPKVFLIENVKGLLSINKGDTFNLIINKLKDIKRYKIYHKVLNSNNYNVPQKRERLFIIGINNSINKIFKFPKANKYKPVLKDVLINCPKSLGKEYNEKKTKLFKLIPPDGCWINLPVDMQKEYLGKSYYSGGGKRGILKRLSMDKPSLTLLTTPSQKQTERCHPIETRPLQILEYARIQTFPDDFKFAGSINQIYKQIGNAVPVNLAKSLAEEIKKILQ